MEAGHDLFLTIGKDSILDSFIQDLAAKGGA